MADLAWKSALAGLATPGRTGVAVSSPGVVLTERTRLALALLQARRDRGGALAQRIAERFGTSLPVAPRVAVGRDMTFIWSGPGRWLAVGETLAPGAAEAALRAAVGGDAVVIGQTDAYGVVRISGPAARDVLARGLPIDLHPRAFQPGHAALTFAEQIAVQIWQVDDHPTYDIAFPRSSSGSFWHWLTESAAPFGCEVTQAG